MKLIILHLIFLLLIWSCSQSQVNSNSLSAEASSNNANNKTSKVNQAGDVLKLVKREVIDKEGTGLVASTYLLPADWTVQDRLYWEYNDATWPIRVKASMKNADGTMAIQIFPDVRAVYSTGPTGASGYPPPRDIISGMKDLITQERKGIQFQYVSDKVLQNTNQNTQYGMQYNQAGVVKISFIENGKSFEEEFYAKLEIVHVVTPSLYGNMESTIWIANGLMACKAVGGKMEQCRKIGETIFSSAQFTKPFYNRLSQVIQLLSDQVYASIYQAGQISKIISNAI